MNLIESGDQGELRKLVRRFLAQHTPEAYVRQEMADAASFDRRLWLRLATELGLQAMCIPEKFGGAGFTWAEQRIVLEELGRALLPSPYLATAVLAATALEASEDTDAQSRDLPRIADGSLVATVALLEDSGIPSVDVLTSRGVENDGGYAVTGRKLYVPDGMSADVIFAFAQTSSGATLFRIDTSDPGVTIAPMTTMDQTRKLATVEFDGADATLVGELGNGRAVSDKVVQAAALALAAEAVGGMQKCLEDSVSYAGERVQFGRPIGSFQAIKHKCAEMLLLTESAKSAVTYAAACAATGHEDFALSASIAKAYAGEGYFRVATENIQIHGGIGFTWEHNAHLYYKRAKSNELFFGDPAYHRARVAELIGL